MFDWLRKREANKMAAKYLGSIIRTLLGVAGGAGLMSDGELEQLAGALVAAGTGLWSLWQKHRAQQEQERAAEAAAMQTAAVLTDRL